MKLELRLGLRQSLAPQLIQSLKMLQMPVLKLEQTLRQELSTNPLLEEVEAVETEETQEEQAILGEATPAEAATAQESAEQQFDWESYFDEGSEFVPKRVSEHPEEIPERASAAETSLYDHLIEQLQLTRIPDDELEIGEYIIGNLNDDGLLRFTVEELAADLKLPPEKVAKVLALVQTFDPPGVGARDLRESILIQFAQRGQADSLAARVVAEHWQELDRKTHMQLAQSLGVSVERVHQAMEELRELSPRPAQGRFTVGARPVVPDLIVDRVDDEYIVYHNDRNVPRLRINNSYKDLLRRGQNVPTETKQYVREKLEQARWLLNAINQRRSTMIRVMEAIVEEQKEFFEKGPAFLKPLIMEDIAQKVGVNVATISRVANDKFVQTPQGVREIKYFFNSGVARTDGESMTKPSVKQRIAAIITSENPATPFSDQEIYQQLQQEGIKLARRTVTKYREELHLPPARFRKTVFDKPAPVDGIGPAMKVVSPDGVVAAPPMAPVPAGWIS
ncbi:MAG: RNA polymerase factor sigma-54 [candidate division Zixibacteria bacterium]|nr:RNA polymerase factor sigma-54 [candidate division Zixibacteria bacterium]